ncbi:MAG: hypothetical protein LBU34_13030 [Planctomycetaceae bacterium]|jgi:hypothetical protein|nr:hypothetical protein [Planctomycetaceae bacterium]
MENLTELYYFAAIFGEFVFFLKRLDVQNAGNGVLQLAFGVLQLAFGVLQLVFGVLQLAFGVLQLAFGVLQLTFGVLRLVVGVLHFAIFLGFIVNFLWFGKFIIPVIDFWAVDRRKKIKPLKYYKNTAFPNKQNK